MPRPIKDHLDKFAMAVSTRKPQDGPALKVEDLALDSDPVAHHKTQLLDEMLIVAILAARNIEDTNSSYFSQPNTHCTVQCGCERRRTSSVGGNVAIFNEKFVFGRDANAFGTVSITVNTNGSSRNASVSLDLDKILSTQEGVYDQWLRVNESDIEVRIVVHHIPMQTTQEKTTLNSLSTIHKAINDDDDLQRYGKVFPELWYTIPNAYPMHNHTNTTTESTPRKMKRIFVQRLAAVTSS